MGLGRKLFDAVKLLRSLKSTVAPDCRNYSVISYQLQQPQGQPDQETHPSQREHASTCDQHLLPTLSHDFSHRSGRLSLRNA